MKQTFVVEFTHAPNLHMVSEHMLWDAIWKGLKPLENNLPSYITVQETTVEQSVERLQDQEKTPKNIIQLDYSPSEGYRAKYTSKEHEEYIEEIQG